VNIPFYDPGYPYEGFSDIEADEAVRDYVCPICYGNLTPYHIPGTSVNLVVCQEHGNVEQIGRVTKRSIEIREAQARRAFKEVIRNLPDLWGELIPPKQSVEQNIKELGF